MARKKTTKKSTASKNNKKLENLNYTDGVDSKTKDIEKIKNLESLLGVKSSNAYGTRDSEVFENNLSEIKVFFMNLISPITIKNFLTQVIFTRRN